MLQPRYEIETTPDLKTFEFISSGPNGHILKVIKYTETSVSGFFNLGFGDKDITTGELNDLAVSNNADGRKVLATVASTILLFFSKYPDATVVATGSTASRIILCRMGIVTDLPEIEQHFYVYGLTENG